LVNRYASVLTGGILATFTALHVVGLNNSPLYLLNDEIHSALQSLALATTGRSIAGDFLPVYFREPGFPAGRDPIGIYVSALFVKLLPLSETAVRMPSALAAVANVLLAYRLGREIGGRRLGLLAAVMLATAPGHFIHGRMGIAPLWPLPFLLGWLLGLARFQATRNATTLAVSAFCLGMAAYGYVGTGVLVPLYLAGTVAWLYWDARERTPRPFLLVMAGLIVPIALAAYWHALHPERWTELLGYYEGGGSNVRPMRQLLNFEGIQERVTTYWNYFDPTFLFLAGDDGLRYSTGRAGVFLLASLFLLPVGIFSAVKTAGIGRLLVFGFFCSPLVGALQGRVHIQRVLPLVLFGALLSAMGVEWLLSHHATRVRRLAAVLIVCVALQFLMFLTDYFGDYRRRSGSYRGGNVRGAFEEAIRVTATRPSALIFLSENLPNSDLYWRFYVIALRADNLRDRMVMAQPTVFGAVPIPSGSVLIAGSQEKPRVDPPVGGSWQFLRTIPELDGFTMYAVYQYAPPH